MGVGNIRLALCRPRLGLQLVERYGADQPETTALRCPRLRLISRRAL